MDTAGADVCEFLVGLLARSEAVPRFVSLRRLIFRLVFAHFWQRQEHGRHVKEVTLDTLYLMKTTVVSCRLQRAPDLKIKSTCVLVAGPSRPFVIARNAAKPTELCECRISAHAIAELCVKYLCHESDYRSAHTQRIPAWRPWPMRSENLSTSIDFYRQPLTIPVGRRYALRFDASNTSSTLPKQAS
jgi:hypothetical protein